MFFLFKKLNFYLKKFKRKTKYRRIYLRHFLYCKNKLYKYILTYNPNKIAINNLFLNILEILNNRCKEHQIQLIIDKNYCQQNQSTGLYEYYVKNYKYQKKIYLETRCNDILKLLTFIHEIGHNIIHEKQLKQKESKATLAGLLFIKQNIQNKYIWYILFKYSCFSEYKLKLHFKHILNDYYILKKNKSQHFNENYDINIFEKKFNKSYYDCFINVFKLKNQLIHLKYNVKKYKFNLQKYVDTIF